MEKAYGGVIINAQGQVLLREPLNHYDGCVWTFAKGKQNPGETPNETALREVEEETGVRGTIVAKIPGSFPGSTTNNEYFLMVPFEDTKKFKDETQTVRWVTAEEATTLISMTKNLKGRARDLSLLSAAVRVFEALKKGTAK